MPEMNLSTETGSLSLWRSLHDFILQQSVSYFYPHSLSLSTTTDTCTHMHMYMHTISTFQKKSTCGKSNA